MKRILGISWLTVLCFALPVEASVVAFRPFSLDGTEYFLRFSFRSKFVQTLSEDLGVFAEEIGALPLTLLQTPQVLNQLIDDQILLFDAVSQAWYIRHLQALHLVDFKENPELKLWLFRFLASAAQVQLSRLDVVEDRVVKGTPVKVRRQVRVGLANILFPHRGRILIESRYHFRFPKIPAVPVNEDFKNYPFWIPRWVKHTGGRVYRGGRAQFNSLLIDKEEAQGKSLFPLLIASAYTHGVFSVGRIIEKGKSVVVDGVRVRGPALILPAKIAIECLGQARREIFSKLGFEPVRTFDGDMHVMEVDAVTFLKELPNRLSQLPGAQWLKSAVLGPMDIPMSFSDGCAVCRMLETAPFSSQSLDSCMKQMHR